MERQAPLNPALGTDLVTRPAHYTQGRIELLDFIGDQQLGFMAGNMLKYVCRHRWKGTPLVDLRKARVYLDKLIRQEESRAAGAKALRKAVGTHER